MTKLDIVELEKRLLALAEKEQAQPMKAYMKNNFEFLGVRSPDRRKAANPNFKLKLATHKKFTRRLVVQAFFRVIINPIFDKSDFFQSRFLGSFW